jgi:hypothetical protein
MSKKYDVTAITGKYTDKNGQEKNRYLTIGAIIETKNGPMLKLESVPMEWNGWAYLNEPRAKDAPGQSGQTSQAPAPVDDSDIPF